MDLKFIEKLLTDHIDGDGRLELSASAAAPLGASIAALYPAYFNDQPFVVTRAGISLLTQPDRVLLTGTGASSPLDGLPLRAYFTISTQDQDAAAVEIVANPEEGWFFPNTFAALGGTFFDTLEIGSPGFTLRSDGTSAGTQGFVFAGVLLAAGKLAYLKPLLRDVFKFEVIANIAMAGDVPEFDLLPKTLVPAVRIGKLPPLELRLVARAEYVNAILDTYLLLEGRLTFTRYNGDEGVISVGVDLTKSFGQVLRFLSTTDDRGLRISDIVALVDQADVPRTLPPVLTMLDAFELKRWEMMLDLSTFLPLGVRVIIASTRRWEIVPELLEVGIDALDMQALRANASWSFATSLNASLVIPQDPRDATITIRAVYPGFDMWGSLVDGDEIDVKRLVGRYISADAASALPEEMVIDEFALSIAPSTGSFSFYIAISTEWPIAIGAGNFSITGFALGLERLAQPTTGTVSGSFALGALEPVPVDVTATYDTIDGWTFDGGLTPDGPPMPLVELIGSYFDANWKPRGLEITVRKFRVTFRQKDSYYHFVIDTRCEVDLGGYFTPALKAAADLEYFGKKETDKYVGWVSGEVEIAGLALGLKVEYPKNDYIVYLAGIEGRVTSDPSKITFTFPNKSVGDLIAMLVQAATKRPFTLPAPWDVLNLINLSDFTLEVHPSKSPIEIGLIYAPKSPINFWFLTIDGLELWYRRNPTTRKNTIQLSITGGTFLGQPIDKDDPPTVDPLDPGKAPKVPGAGEQFFKLEFLGVGQRVALKSGVALSSVTQAVGELQKAFKPPASDSGGSPIGGTGLIASDHVGWVVGLRATLLGAIDLAVVFIDPDLYGLAVEVAGKKFPKLAGLKFEILYKRINETVGVYQLELKVPDFLRQLEFGAVSITLPIIGIEIFTNGNFRLDFGFPAQNDFTRSFALQALPFTGAGGFYFGWLSGATAKRVPQTTHGEFNPVIEAGIGLRVGIGRDINKGILKAGLSLTVAGIVEGTLAFYHPNDGDERYENALYYYVSGQIALVGQLYGEINFAIISARLDVLISIGAGFVIEAYAPVVVTFNAEIRVALTVRINLGLFKISISLSFSATISEKFTIGTGSADKPWDHGLEHLLAGGRARSLSALDPPRLVELKFHAVVREPAVPVTLFLMPQLTPASEIDKDVPLPAKTQCVAMLYVPTSVGQAEVAAEPTAFDQVARGILVWTLAALLFPNDKETDYEVVVDHDITLTQLEQILETLDHDSTEPKFERDTLIASLASYFEFTVRPAPKDDEQVVAVFPMLTPIVLKRPDGTDIRFDGHASVDRKYFEDVRKYFARMNADYLAPEREARLREQAASHVVGDGETTDSMAAWMMMDYASLLAKGAVQAAIDTMRTMAVAIGEEDSLRSLLEREPWTQVGLERLVRANRTRPLRPGVRLDVPPFVVDVRRGDTLASIASRFGVGLASVTPDVAPDAVSGAHVLTANFFQNPPRVRVSGAVHHASDDECLLGIARSYGVSALALAQQNADVRGLFAPGRRLPPQRPNSARRGPRLLAPDVERIVIRDLLERMQQEASFEHLAGSASRVLLHGLRPPVPDPPDQEKWPETTALYQFNGQQFDVSAVVEGQSFDLHIDPALDWLVFEPDPTRLEVKFGEEEIKAIKSLENATLDPLITSLEPMPFFKERPKAFALGSAIEWRPLEEPSFANRLLGAGASAANVRHSLWAFPQDLMQRLLDDPDRPLAVQVVEQTNDAPHLPFYAIGNRLPGADYSWAARIDITLRQVRGPAGALVANTYELWGADVAASDVLQQLLTFTENDSPIASLAILYAPSPVNNTDFNGLYSKPIATTSLFLVQTNLSTAANPDVGMAGARAMRDGVDAGGGLVGMTALEFVRLVWESSVVRSGGFYVYYRDDVTGEGLPDYLFNATDEVTVSLLVILKDADDLLRPYMNTLAVAKDIDISQTTFGLLAPQVPERAPTMPPGCVGVMVSRTPPNPQPLVEGAPITEADTDPYVAETYNLLNYRINPSGGFDESPFGMSAGPVEEDTAPVVDFDRPNRPRLRAAGTWDYKAVLPVYRFATPTIGGARFGSFARRSPAAAASASDPDPFQNPYRGIGGTVAIGISWLDLFGNRIATKPQVVTELKVPVRYTDHLIALDQWPSLSADFMVEGPGAPTLKVRLLFNDTLYTAGTDDSRRAAVADRAVYERIYFQLNQPGVIATLGASTDNAANACTAALVAYALAIWNFLNDVAEGRTPVPPGERTIEQTVSDRNERQVYQLAVTVAVTRPSSHIADDLRAPEDDPVWRVAAPVGPRYDEAEPGAPLTLHDFAKAFEQAFPHLALATAAPRAASNPGGTARDIWVVRFGGADGIVYEPAAQAVFLAPLPVSRRLLSTRVSLHPYVSGKPIWEQPAVEQSFSTVDLELMARGFLAAADLFLAPQLVVPAWLAWNQSPQAREEDNPILGMLAAKKALAATIARRIGPVFADLAPTPGGLRDAVDKLEQQLLVRLSDLYTVDAIVQFPVSVQSRFSGVGAPRLFGKTVVEEPLATRRTTRAERSAAEAEPKDYTFSTSSIALANDPDRAFLTFLFGTRDPAAASEVTLPLAFQRSHLQHDFAAVPGSDYEASQWLAFVTLVTQEPIDWRLLSSRSRESELGLVSIPVPLRAYPPAPALLAQDGYSARMAADAAGAPASINPALDEAKRWVFAFTYRYEAADQDTIYANVHFNIPESTARPVAANLGDPDLLDALVQFSAAWPGVQADLDTSLVEKPDPALAVTTMRSLAWLTGRVQRAWEAWPVDGRAVLGAVPEITLDIEMRQRSVTQQGVDHPVFAIEVKAVSSGREYRPDVVLDGCETEPWKPASDAAVESVSGPAWTGTYVFVKDGGYLTPEQGREMSVRRVRVPNLDLLAEQNARAGLRIRRNEALSPDHPTNEAFVYETPDLRFGSVFVPILEPAVPIHVQDSSKEPPDAPKLYHYLLNFLIDFFTPAGGVPPIEGGVLRLEGGFRYGLDHDPGAQPLDITLPIFLMQPVSVAAAAAALPDAVTVTALAQTMAGTVLGWLEARGLTGRDGVLALRLTLYASRQEEQLPVLQLNDITLDMRLI